MANTRVLVIEDDADINQIVTTHLARSGYTCTQAFSGTEAQLLLDSMQTHGESGASPVSTSPSFDIIICDLMLPGITGEELIALIRKRNSTVPIIVTSARTATTDKVDLLKLGADDYLSKPFDLDELVARIEVQLRHRGRISTADGAGSHATDGSGAGIPSTTLRFRDWELDPEAHTFIAGGAPVELTRIEFRIVEILMRHPKRVWTKQELFEQAWGEPYAADDNTVNVHVSNIRTKLKASGTDGYIKTVWGMGFKLVED